MGRHPGKHHLPSHPGTQTDAAAALVTDPGLDFLFSRRIPDAAAWRR